MSTKSRETSENQCLGCGKHNNALFECTGCLDASFCSQECQKKTWSTHHFDCLPCSICGQRIPGNQVRRDCACKKGGFSHVTCLVEAAIEDSGGQEWSHASTQWERCKLCGEPFTGDTKKVLDRERKARVEKAKERLQILLDVRQDQSEEIDCASSSVELARDCIQLYHGLYGKDDWSSNHDIHIATFFLGRASIVFGLSERSCGDIGTCQDEALRAEAQSMEASSHRCDTESCKGIQFTGEHSTALPLYEELYEKHYRFLANGNRFHTTKWLTKCYFHTSAWKKARNMVKVAHELSERLYGRDDQRTLDLIETGVDIIDMSYNTAKSLGMEDIPDGTELDIVQYRDSRFDVAVIRDTSRENYYEYPNARARARARLFRCFSRTSYYDS